MTFHQIPLNSIDLDYDGVRKRLRTRKVAMPLNDATIRTLEPAAKSFRKPDGRGLYIEIYPDGAKLWRSRYRFLDEEKRFALGAYPDSSLLRSARSAVA